MVIQNRLIVSIQMKENRSRYMFSENIIYLKNAASHLTNKSADFVLSIRNFKRYSLNLPSLKVEGSKKISVCCLLVIYTRFPMKTSRYMASGK